MCLEDVITVTCVCLLSPCDHSNRKSNDLNEKKTPN